MASNHVPSDQAPLQAQNIYTDPTYQTLFAPTGDRYGTPSWDPQLNPQSGLAQPATPQAWHHGSYTQQPYTTHSQPYGAQANGLRTASPYQYGQFAQQGPVANYGQASNVDPSLGLDPNTARQQQQSPYPMPMRHATPQGHSGTVTPQALQHNPAALQNPRPIASPYQVSRTLQILIIASTNHEKIPKSTSEIFAQQRIVQPSSFVKPVAVPHYEIPTGKRSAGHHVLDQAALAKATNSIALNKFVNIGSDYFHLATNRSKTHCSVPMYPCASANLCIAALPTYNPRQSVRDLKKAGADNKKLRAKLLSSKSQSRALKVEKKAAGSRYGVKREVSDSESSTDSSEDDSEYTDDEEEETMPLPASRPDDPHEAVRYDVIKATWCPATSSPSSDKIKSSMRDIWEILSTIQKRWRADAKAVSDAEEQNKTGELPVLKSRVASQRDLLQSALKSLLEHAHPDVVYHMGQIKPFLYLCYQFLANRLKHKDFDGALPSVIFEVLARCGTLTTELLEETKVIKALTPMKRHVNEQNKNFIQQVTESAASNSKKPKASSPPRTESSDSKSVKRPAADAAIRSTADGAAVKKPRPAEPLTHGLKREPIHGGLSKPSPAAGILAQKKPGEKPASASAPAPIKTRITQVANKPSGIFASLTAPSKKPVVTPGVNKSNAIPKPAPAGTAAKEKKPVATSTSKPAFSFAQTMASLLKPKEQEAAPVKAEKQIPAETQEEKTRRLRKESRRHLRVTFRPDTSLVDIRYFNHVPEEDMGHEENLVRDAGDIGGEGRMFKQHKELDVEEDDDAEDDEAKAWNTLSLVDFSVVTADERKRNYVPFGGGEVEPSCPEREANVRRENSTLMVFYADAKDIPPSPREPSDDTQETAAATTPINFGAPPESVLKKCPRVEQTPPALDFSGLENIFKQFANPTPAPAAPPAPVQNAYNPPVPTVNPQADLASILSALGNVPAPPAPASVAAPVQQPMQPQFDLSAFMANLQAQAATGAALPPPPPGPMPPGYPPFPFAFPNQTQPQDAAAYQPQMQSQYDQQSNGGNKRQREESNNNNTNAQGKRHKNRGERPHKVLACKFYQKGTCNKGDNCTYIHDLNG